MQKLDLYTNIRRLVRDLKAEEIHKVFLEFFTTLRGNSENPWSGAGLIPLLLDGKSNFDSMKRNSELATLVAALKLNGIYTTEAISKLVPMIGHQRACIQYLSFDNFLNFFFASRDLLRAEILCEILLVANPKIRGFADTGSDVTIFQISKVDSPLSLDALTKILKTLSELIEYLTLILGQEPSPSEIVLLDSGSPVGIGVKTDPEKASALVRLFKEVFDSVVFFKYVKTERNLNSLTHGIDVLERIKDAEAKGVLKPEKAMECSTMVMREVEELLGMGVLPKQLVEIERVQTNVELLKNFTAMKQLSERTEPPTEIRPALPSPPPNSGGGEKPV